MKHFKHFSNTCAVYTACQTITVPDNKHASKRPLSAVTLYIMHLETFWTLFRK